MGTINIFENYMLGKNGSNSYRVSCFGLLVTIAFENIDWLLDLFMKSG